MKGGKSWMVELEMDEVDGKRKAKESPKQRIHVQFDRNVVRTSIFSQWRSGNQSEVKALSRSRFAAESLQSVGHLLRFLFR